MSQLLSEQKLSVVIPICEKGENSPSLLNEYLQEIRQITANFEVIIPINATYEHLQPKFEAIIEDNKDANIILVPFSRNYGEGTLLKAAFEKAEGDYVLTLPPFKQVEASELERMFDKVGQSDLILAKRWPRVDSGFKQNVTKVFSSLANKLTDQHYSDPGCHVRLLTKEAAKEINLYGDQHRFLHLLAFELGYISTEQELKQARENADRESPGPGLYLRRFLDLLTIVFLTKFNKKPLRFFGILGSSSIVMGFLGLLYLTYERLILDVNMADRPLLVLFSLFFVLGIQLIGIGLIGETIIFTHAGEHKEYRIKKVHNMENTTKSEETNENQSEAVT